MGSVVYATTQDDEVNPFRRPRGCCLCRCLLRILRLCPSLCLRLCWIQSLWCLPLRLRLLRLCCPLCLRLCWIQICLCLRCLPLQSWILRLLLNHPIQPKILQKSKPAATNSKNDLKFPFL